MAESPALQLVALGVIGYAGYALYQQGAFGTPRARAAGPNQPVTQFGGRPQPVKQGQVQTQTPQGSSDPNAGGPTPRAAGLTLANQYNQQNPDGSWWQVNQWSDGSYSSTYIDPSQYAAYGIPQPNGQPTPTDPNATNNFDVAAGNPAATDQGGPPVVYGPGDKWWQNPGNTPGASAADQMNPYSAAYLGVPSNAPAGQPAPWSGLWNSLTSWLTTPAGTAGSPQGWGS